MDGMVVVGEEETVVKLLFREPEFIAEIKDSHDRKVTRPTKTAWRDSNSRATRL